MKHLHNAKILITDDYQNETTHKSGRILNPVTYFYLCFINATLFFTIIGADVVIK